MIEYCHCVLIRLSEICSELNEILYVSSSVPGPPSRAYCPEVALTAVTVAWSPPLLPNGVILGYSLSYSDVQHSDNSPVVFDNLPSDTRQFTVSKLIYNSKYMFHLKAKTSVGWGSFVELPVVVTTNRGWLCIELLPKCNS